MSSDPSDQELTTKPCLVLMLGRYLQIWTGAKAAFGVDAVVLEPLGAMSDGFNNHDGLHVISPGETFKGSYKVALV